MRVSLGESPEAVLMRGGSVIVNPLGQVLAGPHFGSETILTADLDLNDIGAASSTSTWPGTTPARRFPVER